MNISEEIRISTYQPVTFVADTELAKLYETMNDYWELDKESNRVFAASVFYNLGRVHGKREERARRAKQASSPRTIDLQEEYREETKRLLDQLHDLIMLRRIYTIVLRVVERRKKS